jgi:hypothetical protein
MMRAFLALCALLMLTTQAMAKPATTIKIPETSEVTFPNNESPWFFRANINADPTAKGAYGLALTVGHMGQRLFWDGQINFTAARYGALRVYQPIGNGTPPLDSATEIGRPRTDADQGYVFSIGGGVGTMFRIFDSENWVEIARFGLGYGQFEDTTNSLTFRGAVISFTAEAGYRLSPKVMLVPGLTYNLGLMTRVGNSGTSTSADFDHNRFLPIAWFAAQLGLAFFL